MNTILTLTLFGAPTLTLAEQPLLGTLSGKALALLSYLAVTERPQRRDTLADLLWSEFNNQQARNNLRYTLHDLRQLVGDFLLITPQTVGFNRQTPYQLDVEILRTALTAKGPFNRQEVQRALSLFQGEFLAGFSVRNAPVFEEWVVQQRTEYHLLASQGFYRLAEYELAQGMATAGLEATRRLLQLDPYHEAGHRLQMRLLVQTGLPHLALEQYQQLQRLLDETFQSEPEAETQQLYEQIRTGKLVADLPGPAVAVTVGLSNLAAEKPPEAGEGPLPQNNLPGELTPFIGRTEEIATITATLLTHHQRLITLVGEGGIGKTRLGLAVAYQVQDHFPDGIWFVPLTGLAATADLPDRLAGTIGAVMQFSFSGQSSLSEQLFRYLRTKQSLLLLDSFEHLLEGADFILELLRNTSALKILVTSRHILNFQAEYTWRVDGLSVPPNDEAEQLAPELLLRYESIALFVERARRVVRGFSLTENNQKEVVRICQFVQGLPLGAELAAALTRHYTCKEIIEALKQNYAFLATAQRDMLPRHRSIQATLAYSWSFLNEQQTQIAAQCALFRGGFTVDAAEAIMGANRALLTVLEDHSLLRLVKRRTGGSRYEMHELVRQYAAEQLQSRPLLSQQAHERFCTYYTAFVAERVEALVYDQQAQLEMQSELNNLRQAWQWSVDRGDIQALAQSSDGLFRFYYLQGMYQEGESAAQAAVTALRKLFAAAEQTTMPEAKRASAPAEITSAEIEYELVRDLLTQARFGEKLAHLAQAEELSQEGLQRAQALGAAELEVRGYLGLASIAQIRLDNATMRALGERMLDLVAAGHLSLSEGIRMKSYGLKYIGIYHVQAGTYEQAKTMFREGLQLAQQIADRELETMLINNLGVVYTMAGDFSEALRCFQQTLTISQSLGERNAAGLALINLAETYHILGEWEEAKTQIGQALALYHEIGYQLYEAKAWARLGRIAQAAGNPLIARSYLEHALQMAHNARLERVQAEFQTDLGHILLSLHDFAEAERAYQQALTGWQQVNARQPAWRVQAGLAQLALVQDQPARALSYVHTILETLGTVPHNALYEPVTVYAICAQVLAANRDPTAADLWQRGQTLLAHYADKIDDLRLRRSFLESYALGQTATLSHS